MNKRLKKILIILGCLIGIAVVVLSVKRITYINNKYPNPPIVVFKQGEDIQGSNLKIKVVDSDIMDKEVFEKNYAEFDENPDNEQLMNQEMKVMVVKFNVENNGDKISRFVFANFIAQSGGWSNGWNLEMYRKINDYNENSIEVKPGESKELKLVYCMYKSQFKKSHWNNLESRKFYIIMSSYPVNNRIELSIKR